MLPDDDERPMVPLFSGNLGVDHLMRVWSGASAEEPPAAERRRAAEAELDRWRELGVVGVEEYLAWGVAERSRDAWDFGQARADLAAARARGMDWLVYPWVHVVPHWYRAAHEVVGFRCLEHDRDCGWPSIFAPSTLELFDRVYAALRREFGDEPDGLCLALPADYGEVAYPTGWGNWVAPLTPPLDHLHVGFWAGDRYARERWRSFAAEIGGLPDRLDLGDVDPSTRRAFAGFYAGALTDFVEAAVAVVRAHFPRTPLTLKIGHGGESLAYGIDPTRLAELAARHGLILRSTQATLPQLHHKRLEASCRHFAVPLGTEPPVDIGRETALARLFADLSSGLDHFFDYPEHLDGARDLHRRFLPWLDREGARSDVALFFDTAVLHQRPERGFPPILHELAEEIRDRLDYELLDEALILRGALDGQRVLGLTEAAEPGEEAQNGVLRWVEQGGWLVVGPEVAGEGPLFRRIEEAPAADDSLRMVGDADPCVSAILGGPCDRLFLAGEWHDREDAAQFRATPPQGEGCRWTGAEASIFLPVRPDHRHLLEVECWVHPRMVDRAHRVFAGARELGAVTRPGLQRWTHWMEAGTGEGGVVELRFVSEPFTAGEIGNPEDGRRLGLNVMWVRATREGCAVLDRGRHRLDLRVAVDEEIASEARGLSVGAGRILVSRRRPHLRFLALLEEAARRRSHRLRDWFALGEARRGLRAAVFPQRVVVWNRADATRSVRWPGGEELQLEPGQLGRIDLASRDEG